MEVPEFGYPDDLPSPATQYLEPVIFEAVGTWPKGTRVLDIGCGHGNWAGKFLKKGFAVVGIDPSEQGMAMARKTYPQARFERLIATDDLLERINEPPFDLVVSIEVVEHVYEPKDWASAAFKALAPGGKLVCSTPYHGYLKNLALSITNTWDRHLTPLWSGGHIKFFSYKTLTELLTRAGFVNVTFRGSGRVPYLWKSMVLTAEKPRQAG
jgi:2-polyprenyl-6-hydroxyphenyl methylase/3-demethylubiquinone-9 3-methyltransferase